MSTRINQLNPLFTSVNDGLFVPTEYICLPNFLIAGSDIIESVNCTVFNIQKLYGWESFSNTYSLILFDANVYPTVSIWQNSCLTLYQNVPTGYLRLTYSVKVKQKPGMLADSCLTYSFFCRYF